MIKEKAKPLLNIILTRRHDQCENQMVYKKHLFHSSMTKLLTKFKAEFKLVTASLGWGMPWKLKISSDGGYHLKIKPIMLFYFQISSDDFCYTNVKMLL